MSIMRFLDLTFYFLTREVPRVRVRLKVKVGVGVGVGIRVRISIRIEKGMFFCDFLKNSDVW